ncbi:hypothetical protein ACVRYF_05390 [Streptococcus intermedius]
MKTLLFGNTGYVTEEFIQEAFPKDMVYLLGETHLKNSKKLKLTVFSEAEKTDMEEILRTYRFDRILYFSNSLTYKNHQVGELERLQSFLNVVKGLVYSKILYITGPEVLNRPQELEIAAESLCQHWVKVNRQSLKIVRSPYLYSARLPEDYFYRLFDKVHENRAISIEEHPDEIANFINSEDLAELISKIFDSWDDQTEILNIYNPFEITFQHVAEKLEELAFSKSKIVIDSKSPEPCLYHSTDKDNLRHRYGWFIHYSLLDDLADLYKDFVKENKASKHLEFNRLKAVVYTMRSHKTSQKIAEILLAFFLSEVLSAMLNGFNQLRMLDVRLLFITLVSTIFGTIYGIFASFLSIIGLFAATILAGGNWQSIVYNTDRWITFAAYMFVALICGIIQMKYQDEKEMLEKENQLLNDRNEFLSISYEDAVYDREQLAQQVVSNQTGTSKLFSIFQQLDKPTVEAVLNETKKIVAEQLETNSVNIYSLSEFSGFNLNRYPILAEELKNDEVWVYKNLIPDYPVYALKIESASGLSYLLWIEDVSYSHLSLSRMHFLQMIGGATASMLDKAGYHQAFVNLKKTTVLGTTPNGIKYGG